MGCRFFNDLAKDFPQAYLAIRRATLVQATKRKIMAAYRRQKKNQKGHKKGDLVDALSADLQVFRATVKTGEWTGDEAEPEKKEPLPQPSELRDLIRTELMLVMREDMQSLKAMLRNALELQAAQNATAAKAAKEAADAEAAAAAADAAIAAAAAAARLPASDSPACPSLPLSPSPHSPPLLRRISSKPRSRPARPRGLLAASFATR